ncbi:MAG: PHP domain-containing protein [Candidatus Coatesbacteria bacterium]|nr:PHP domain-containing protein [Candidatus Coatesbacteria bacterium]
MLRLWADFHVHTCLSPCADDAMTPRAVVETALGRGLSLIAICDHNSAENVESAVLAAESLPLSVLPGMEVTSAEEVHVLGIFESPKSALALQEIVYKHLTPGRNDERLFGYQFVVDQYDYVTSENERLLTGATDLSIDQVVESIHDLGGLAIASHIQRERFGLLYQLGFVPDSLSLDAVELTSKTTLKEVGDRFGCSLEFPVVYDSDAHFMEDIGKLRTEFAVLAPTFSEIALALRGAEGRQIVTSAIEHLQNG